MELISPKMRVDFMGKRRYTVVLSGLLLILALGSLIVQGLKLGIDFTGGTVIEAGYASPVELESVRRALGDAGFDDAIAQYFGTARDVLVRVPPRAGEEQAEISNRVLEALRADNAGGGVELRRVEFVGPQVGDELTEKGGLAMLYAILGILVYVALRFEWRFALGSIAALVHDVVITAGVFSLFRIEFDLSVLAALLAVIGYSLNDTIVVFDRIRENFRVMRKGTPPEVTNSSVNQTLARTLMTSLTTLLVLISLFVFGGEIIHGFAFALIIGVIVGTYSSIYVASPVALALGVSKADLMPVQKEGGPKEQV
ncbi:MAG: protein translocase subunit SecF [Gammaproteobacteria bacterium]|nr:protein translocase subunit SecF [Gammaproteobacteria bacterium]NIR84848.1 protein translocase subunit SecF [Gammaproteobacteria bacterium]NIR91620.1 protein translocase subunit SecF [Gammaproteobacteria bacterium]NIU05899.1 protein translocase subunit SecF [Gammaproteobacteria bacterium]NIV76813.1 protein translocase subunit SecF [Gammaproteobacteria bacterium]